MDLRDVDAGYAFTSIVEADDKDAAIAEAEHTYRLRCPAVAGRLEIHITRIYPRL
jgi:hypothetical protein